MGELYQSLHMFTEERFYPQAHTFHSQETTQVSESTPGTGFYHEKGISSRQLLQRFLNKQNVNRDIFHDLMPFKVKEVLLVATLYDAYSIEKEGHFSEHILGGYHQLNLISMPRVTGVSSYDEAIELLWDASQEQIMSLMQYIGGSSESDGNPTAA